MRRCAFIALCAVFCLGFVGPAQAWEFATTQNLTKQSAQLSIGANANYKWKCGVGIHFSEDLRFGMVEAGDYERTASQGGDSSYTAGADFSKSYTTLSLSYKHPQFPYLRADVGYTLKLVNRNDGVNKFMRHRVFFSLKGSYRYEQWSFSLRERFVTEIRMDDIDLHVATSCYEKNRADWLLRSKAEVAYHAKSKPLKPYLWFELVNTLNANELQQYYANNNPANAGQQYIRHTRAGIGLAWRLTRSSSLDFSYRFSYNYNRDVNVKPNSQKITLTEVRGLQHLISVAYHFSASQGK